jgi:hypothetical protein
MNLNRSKTFGDHEVQEEHEDETRKHRGRGGIGKLLDEKSRRQRFIRVNSRPCAVSMSCCWVPAGAGMTDQRRDDGVRERWPKETKEGGKKKGWLFVLFDRVNT